MTFEIMVCKSKLRKKHENYKFSKIKKYDELSGFYDHGS